MRQLIEGVWKGTRLSSTTWAGERVGRLEGEQQAADQPEGQQEAGGHTHRVHHATQRVVLASEGMAAQHLSIRAEMGWNAGRMLGS